jgi:hypothetical protein
MRFGIFGHLDDSGVPRRRHSMSGRVGWSYALRDLSAALALDEREIVLALQVEPELRAVAEVAAEPDGSIGGDRPTFVQDIRDAAGRDAEIEGEPVGAQFARL